MKYILMCGGNYSHKFEKPKQLLEVNGEIIIERAIRLLKENGITDIVISTDNSAFDYLKVKKIKSKHEYIHDNPETNLNSNGCWLNAYYLMSEPCCYLHGDVYWSENAIKTIVNTEVINTMFFCIRDLNDGRPLGVNIKGREPLAYKVQNNKLFNTAVNELKAMIDKGMFKKDPISWNLYRKINGFDIDFNGYGNDIFGTRGDYIAIDDYTTDIDKIEDIQKIEKMIKILKGGVEMFKVNALEEFYLGRFNEIKNLKRKDDKKQHKDNTIEFEDEFECDLDLANYLSNKPNSIYETDKDGQNNPAKRAVVSIMGTIPEVKEEVKEEKVVAKRKATTRRKRTTKK